MFLHAAQSLIFLPFQSHRVGKGGSEALGDLCKVTELAELQQQPAASVQRSCPRHSLWPPGFLLKGPDGEVVSTSIAPTSKCNIFLSISSPVVCAED